MESDKERKSQSLKIGTYIYWVCDDPYLRQKYYPNGDWGIITKIDMDEEEKETRYWAKWHRDKWAICYVYERDIKKIFKNKEEFENDILVSEL